MTIERLLTARRAVRSDRPLIHCITNPISINDCANAILAVGAQPIMAEHPQEVAAITQSAGALLVNLGNITDVRMASMQLSAAAARAHGVPIVIDLVGVACSPLRLDFARAFVQQHHPALIKGNLTELKAFAGLAAHTAGVDAAADDLHPADSAYAALAQLARRTGSVVFATGETDAVTDGRQLCLLHNGHPLLARVTGTGCVVGALAACFLSRANGLTAAALAAALLGICGECAAEQALGTGTFRTALLDHLSMLEDETLRRRLRLICRAAEH